MRLWIGVALLGVLSGSAHAGALSKVVHGLEKQSGQDRDRDDDSDDDRDNGSDSDYYSHDDSDSDVEVGYWGPSPSVQLWMPDMDGYVYGAYQNVHDSDGSLSFRANTGYRRFAVEGGVTSYYEHIVTPGVGPETLALNVWDISLAVRALGDRRTALWGVAGVAGAHSGDMSLAGVAVGVRASHEFTRGLRADVSLRELTLKDIAGGAEFRASVTASVFQVAYRYLNFIGTGPALHGPEIGLAYYY